VRRVAAALPGQEHQCFKANDPAAQRQAARPVRALASTLRARGPQNRGEQPAVDVEAQVHRGPVFRRLRRSHTPTDQRLTNQSVALILKRHTRAAGVPSTQPSGHSLRAGYATAAGAGIEERKIANVTRVTRTSLSCTATSAATAFDDDGYAGTGSNRTPRPLTRVSLHSSTPPSHTNLQRTAPDRRSDPLLAVSLGPKMPRALLCRAKGRLHLGSRGGAARLCSVVGPNEQRDRARRSAG